MVEPFRLSCNQDRRYIVQFPVDGVDPCIRNFIRDPRIEFILRTLKRWIEIHDSFLKHL